MKKALIVLMAALALFSLVSCEEEEPARPVKVQYDGNTFEFDYVICVTDAEKSFVGFALTTNKDAIDVEAEPITIAGKHFSISIPASTIGNLNPDLSEFFLMFADEGAYKFMGDVLDEGSTFGCSAGFDSEGKVSNLDLSLDGKIGGKAFKLEFHGTPDFSNIISDPE